MAREIRHIQTNLLNIAYEECGPADGFPVILLHGWPDDARSWDSVCRRLASVGFRTVAPYLRGCGPTGFLEDATIRSGQLAALGHDVMDMAKALRLDRFALVGHDWGARAAYFAATEYGQHISQVVAISVGYGTNHPDQVLPLHQARNYWYHWYFCLPRGIELVAGSRRELCRFLWDTWSPTWRYATAEFDDTARSFDNPDWAEITIHSYRHRWGLAEGDPRYDELETRLTAVPASAVPTLVLHGAADTCNAPVTSEDKQKHFTNRYQRRLLPGVGHFPQREDPETVANEVIAWLRS